MDEIERLAREIMAVNIAACANVHAAHLFLMDSGSDLAAYANGVTAYDAADSQESATRKAFYNLASILPHDRFMQLNDERRQKTGRVNPELAQARQPQVSEAVTY